MSEDEVLALQAEERRRLIGLFHATKATCFLEAALRLARGGDELDEADIDRIKHGDHTAAANRPTLDDAALLWAMAAEMRADPKLTPTTAARLVAIRTGVGHSLESTVSRLRGKWNALLRPDAAGVAHAWWARKIRDGGYPEHAERLVKKTEKTTT